MRKITIDPITRLEGHGKIEIFLNDSGAVENAYLQVPEFRGFERFCEGRPAEELARITTRICGVCPWAHHIASAKCLDDLFKVEVPQTGKNLREMAYAIYSFYDKIIHFYFLAAPDFVVGPDAPAGERNILGLIGKVGLDIGKQVIGIYKDSQEVLQRLGGKTIHPVWGLPGGVSKGITDDERKEIAEKCKQYVEFAKFSLKIFNDIVLGNKGYVDVITGDVYQMKSYYMGLVDDNNKVNFYDGAIRVVDPDGAEFARFRPQDYLDHISEEILPWTYLKFPYLKKVGWKGITDGADSGLYRVAPLARLNASEGMATPEAQKEFDRMYETLGGKPAHNTLAYHWARLVELLYSAERALELASDPVTAGDDIRALPTETPTEGVGVVEAPRGTLFHHYWTDEEGMIKKVNLIVATGNNYGAMCYSIKRAAQGLIKDGKVDDGLLNMVEMAFRAYDPCLACATHSLPGQTPLEVNIYDSGRNLLQTMKQGI
ncbi:MAG: Ni/Fe hydrogenase subunit alpha [bacterium]